MIRSTWLTTLLVACAAAPLPAQIDSARARAYFAEAEALCTAEGGRLWGVSLCGPMVFADPRTREIIANQPTPDAPRPMALGYANAALDWGGTKWSVFVWQFLPQDEKARASLMVHELFHRVQQGLGFFLNEAGSNEHLNTIDGRYWLQLEWRALAAALADSGAGRASALGDALAFRARRRALFPNAAEAERVLEINEGLAQYTATAATNASWTEAAADAVAQLGRGPANATLVRTFPYPSGAAYGVLLDHYAPGWTRRLAPTDDLGVLLARAARVEPARDAQTAAERYDARELHAAEVERDRQQRAHVATLRKRFVEGPVLVLPAGKSFAFMTAGITPIPDAGTVYPSFRTTGDWGSLEGELVLVSTDRAWLTVPAPPTVSGSTLAGDGWTITLAEGWRVDRGDRSGDYRVVRDSAKPR